MPSLPLGNGQDFRTGPGCETGPIIPDVNHPDIVYGGCKGQFSRLDLTTANEARYWIGAQSLYGNPGGDLIFRFQRVSPMEVSPYDSRTVYYGSQYVHRTRDGRSPGNAFRPTYRAPRGTQGASGDRLPAMPPEEVYSTLYSIRESTLQRGRDLGGLHDGPTAHRDDGKTWTNVTPKGLPPGGRVQNIEPGTHNPGTAYAAIYRFLLGDFKPYIYRTDDFGKSWTLLTDGRNGIAPDEPTRVVREDPIRAGLLYAGTEFGMHISFDNGSHWQNFQLNLPATPVTDIKVAHQDLVLSTQGRSFWILDNLTPLQELRTALASHRAMPSAPRTRGGGRGSALSTPCPVRRLTITSPPHPRRDLARDSRRCRTRPQIHQQHRHRCCRSRARRGRSRRRRRRQPRVRARPHAPR